MNELTIKIEVPELAAAVQALAAAMLEGKAPAYSCSTPAAEAPQPVAPTAPVPTAPAVPVAPTAPAVPVAGAPTYTLDQIKTAGAALMDAGKMDQLLALLGKYGLQAITQLQPDQYGTFATELRALGAQI